MYLFYILVYFIARLAALRSQYSHDLYEIFYFNLNLYIKNKKLIVNNKRGIKILQAHHVNQSQRDEVYQLAKQNNSLTPQLVSYSLRVYAR